MEIYICDDNELDRRRLSVMLSRYGKRCFAEASLREFADGASLLAAWEARRETPAVIFLDILMDGLDGLSLAEKLRQDDREVPLIFTTSSGAYGLEAFRVFADGYLKKPYTRTELFEALMPFEARFLAGGRTLSVRARRELLQIPLGTIIYMEADKHVTFVYTISETLRCSMDIKELRSALEGEEAFLECGKSYIINLYRVQAREEDIIVMQGGGRVGVPVRLRKQLYAQMEEFWHDHDTAL